MSTLSLWRVRPEGSGPNAKWLVHRLEKTCETRARARRRDGARGHSLSGSSAGGHDAPQLGPPPSLRTRFAPSCRPCSQVSLSAAPAREKDGRRECVGGWRTLEPALVNSCIRNVRPSVDADRRIRPSARRPRARAAACPRAARAPAGSLRPPPPPPLRRPELSLSPACRPPRLPHSKSSKMVRTPLACRSTLLPTHLRRPDSTTSTRQADDWTDGWCWREGQAELGRRSARGQPG